MEFTAEQARSFKKEYALKYVNTNIREAAMKGSWSVILARDKVQLARPELEKAGFKVQYPVNYTFEADISWWPEDDTQSNSSDQPASSD